MILGKKQRNMVEISTAGIKGDIELLQKKLLDISAARASPDEAIDNAVMWLQDAIVALSNVEDCLIQEI